MVPPGYSTQTAPYFRPWIPRTVPLSTPVGKGTWTTVPTIGSSGRSSFFSAPLGVSVVVGGGGGGLAVAVLGGLVGLGAETAFVGRAVAVVGGGGGWAFWPGGSPRRHSRRTTRRKTFASWGGGGGLGGGVAAWLGGGGLGQWWWTPPPSSPSLTPPPSMLPHISSSSPPRIPHLLHPSPLPGPEVAQCHPDAAYHTRGLPVVETARESKAQGWIPGHDAVEGPQGYFLGALSVSLGHPNGRGICGIDHDVNDLQKKKKKKKCELIFSATFLIFRL